MADNAEHFICFIVCLFVCLFISGACVLSLLPKCCASKQFEEGSYEQVLSL